MDKEKIIAEFNAKHKKLKEEYKNLDGTIYFNSIPPDPYGFAIDMPKDKFPQWHKWYEKEKILIQEYQRFIRTICKYNKGDIVIVGCQDSIEFGKIRDEDFFIYGGGDILYYIDFDKNINAWKYGSSGGYFGEKKCSCAFYEKDILMKVSFKEMEKMKNTPIEDLKIIHSKLFPLRKQYKKRNNIKNLIVGFVDKIIK